jgi:hypothetical protein
MTTSPVYSGAYNFLPSTGELVIAAYRRIKIHRAEIVTEHLADAKTEFNLMQVQWANLGPLLWTVALETVNIVQGQNVYSVPPNVVMMLDVYVSIPNGDGSNSDRIITPLSRTEWASMPDKLVEGSPTSFWFDRLINPTVTLWPNPDGTNPTFSYYYFSQIQDATLTNATNAQMPYLCLDAVVAGLSHRLARIYAPDLEAAREVDAVKATNLMLTQLTENVPLEIQPQSSGYWR